MVFLPDLVDGALREVWWVRARAGHSMPVCSSFHSYLHILNFLKDVMTSTKRILNMGKLKAIVYLASPHEWDSMRNYYFFLLKYLVFISEFVRQIRNTGWKKLCRSCV